MTLPTRTVTAGAVVLNEVHQVLLKLDPRRGWELPAGHVEEGETVLEGLVREIKEETGIDIEVTGFCGITENRRKKKYHTWWMAKSIGGTLTTGRETLDVGFYDIDEAFQMIERDDFRETLEMCINVESHPFFVTQE